MIRYRDELDDRLNLVPRGHSTWSIQKARDFKAFVEKARKKLNTKKTSEAELRQLCMEYDSFQPR